MNHHFSTVCQTPDEGDRTTADILVDGSIHRSELRVRKSEGPIDTFTTEQYDE